MTERSDRALLPSFRLSVLPSFVALLAAAQAPVPRPPPPAPSAWRALLGEYGPDSTSRVIILERGGRLIARFDSLHERRLTPGGVRRLLADSVWSRRALGPEEGAVFRVTPVRPVAELRKEALEANPPAETGEFRPTDLVELVTLDPSIRLDIRYASSRNFLGTPLYTQARAFLQRPAAEALLRAQRWLKARGYGLLIHDGYRPWYVTKLFWDATPPAQHEFVANPATGSRHNRGCAVDLTLYELKSGRAVAMPGTYDEFSRRSYASYPGGTSRQRWLRQLLRQAMEAQGFTVNPSEWWHFDYKDWRSYRIGNVPFERVGQ